MTDFSFLFVVNADWENGQHDPKPVKSTDISRQRPVIWAIFQASFSATHHHHLYASMAPSSLAIALVASVVYEWFTGEGKARKAELTQGVFPWPGSLWPCPSRRILADYPRENHCTDPIHGRPPCRWRCIQKG